MDIDDVCFSVNDYDSDGLITESGIYLNFGNTRVRVAKNKKEFADFVKDMQKIEDELNVNYITI